VDAIQSSKFITEKKTTDLIKKLETLVSKFDADVRVSGPFFGWIISLGEGVKIVSPEDVVEQMKVDIERLRRQYC